MTNQEITTLWEASFGSSLRAVMSISQNPEDVSYISGKHWFSEALEHIPGNASFSVGVIVKKMLEDRLKGYDEFDCDLTKTVTTIWQGKEFIQEVA